ncbi:MAG: hypothetical protein MI861_09960 [Pirellulales bacterium]|nr:hypothetical protein [Pirellulales bacterium]
MRKHNRRRIRNLVLLIASALGLAGLYALAQASLFATARTSGWLLLGMILFLAAYNLRKKLPGIPLGSSAAWLQLHIHVGLLTSLVFGLHVSWRLPDGGVETALASLYAIVFVSGILGLALSRSLAKRLTTRGEEVIFERIPIYRKKLAVEVESMIFQSLGSTDSTAIAQFYAERLQPYFARAHHYWHHLLQSNRPRFALLGEMKAYHRFLDEDERAVMQDLESRVIAKDNLDYQYSLQATLKYWLFVHVPATYALILFAFFHLLLVSSFTGAAL